jgi:site-specific DNA-methyltransferase (adenine-specific)/modification methylase
MTRKEVIGDATLYLGDCRDILPTLPKVDAVITDPPYGINYAAAPLPVYHGGKRSVNHGASTWDGRPVEGLDHLLALGKTQIVWGGNYYPLPPTRGWLTWFKPDAPPSMASLELAWTNMDRNARQFTWSIGATNAERVGHPTQKPLALMRWCIEQAGGPSSIFDPFMGSGTTGVAAAQMGLSFIGIEREPNYFDITCRRIEQAYKQRPLFEPEQVKTPQQIGLEV